MSDKNKKSESSLKLWIIAGLIFAAVLLIFGGFTWVMIENFGSGKVDLGSWANAGAAYGMLAALFTGLAFAGLIVTILLQREDLSLQREELKETRKVLDLQREELKNQSETMKKQQFENSFFNLINQLQLKFNNLIYIDDQDKKYYKSEALNECGLNTYSFMRKSLASTLIYEANAKYDYIDPTESVINQMIDNFMDDSKNKDILEYLDYIIFLLKFIDSESIGDKSTYLDFLKVQITQSSLKLIFYRSLCGQVGKNREAIIATGALRWLNLKSIVEPHRPYYEALINSQPIPWRDHKLKEQPL